MAESWFLKDHDLDKFVQFTVILGSSVTILASCQYSQQSLLDVERIDSGQCERTMPVLYNYTARYAMNRQGKSPIELRH